MVRMAAVTGRRMSRELADRFELEALPHRTVLLHSALRLTRHAQDAEDLVQETMVRACAAFQDFKPGTNIRAWLHRIMLNSFINGYRKKQRGPLVLLAPGEQLQSALTPARPAGLTLSAEEQVLARIPAEELVSALRALPPEFRQVVYLVDVEGFSYREAASMMGTPLGTVMSRLHRGRSNLRAQLSSPAALPAC